MTESTQTPKDGSFEWLEGLSRDERMAIVEVFAMYGDQTNPPVEHAALTHLRYLVAECRRRGARIAELEKDSATLAALEAAGVDNWEGYSDALAGVDE